MLHTDHLQAPRFFALRADAQRLSNVASLYCMPTLAD